MCNPKLAALPRCFFLFHVGKLGLLPVPLQGSLKIHGFHLDVTDFFDRSFLSYVGVKFHRQASLTPPEDDVVDYVLAPINAEPPEVFSQASMVRPCRPLEGRRLQV